MLSRSDSSRGRAPASIALAAAVVLLVPPAAVAQLRFDPADIDAVFADFDTEAGPGCAVGVVHDGQLVHGRGYGLANLEHDVPLTTRSVFRVASVSKQLTAAVVVIASLDGHLDLDDQLRKWLPELPAYPEDPTLRQALHHTSGLRDYLTLMSLRGLRSDDFYTSADAVAIVARQDRLNFEPGTAHLYSNSGYLLLTEAVARAVGRPFRDYAHEVLFAPLAMNDTHFHDDHDHLVPRRADGYRPAPDGDFRLSMTRLEMIGDGGLYTTIEDMARWVAALERDAIRPGLRAILETRGVLDSGEEIDYALGQSHGEHRGVATIGHGGSFVGFQAQTLRFPSERTGIITLCNRSDALAATRTRDVADVVLDDRLGPALTEAERAARFIFVDEPDTSVVTNASDYLGTYYSSELDVDYRLTEVQGELRLRAGAAIDEPVGRLEGDTLLAGSLTLRFAREEGRVTAFELDAGRVVGVRFAKRIGTRR